MTSLTEAFLTRGGDDKPGCTFEGHTTPWTKVVTESATRAEILRNFIEPSEAQRFAVLVDDSREYMFWLGAALLSGICMTGLDPTRPYSLNTAALQGCQCQFVVCDDAGLRYLESLEICSFRTIDLKSDHYLAVFDDCSESAAIIGARTDNRLLCSLLLDSAVFGTSTFDVSERQVGVAANQVVRATEMTSYDICYDALPMSCANSVLACWGPALLTGAEVVFQRTFTPEQFFADVREFNCTYFVFAGSMIADLLDMPPSERDREHRLRVGFGTDSTPEQRREFLDRFGCELVEADGRRAMALRDV
ncbi:MAG: AMP-binding protein [Actinomycetota bacterium]